MHSFTQDLTCVTYLLLSETMHLLQVQPGRGGRREAFNIKNYYHSGFRAEYLLPGCFGSWE